MYLVKQQPQIQGFCANLVETWHVEARYCSRDGITYSSTSFSEFHALTFVCERGAYHWQTVGVVHLEIYILRVTPYIKIK